MILIIASPNDPHVDAVIHRLNRSGEKVCRWHPHELSTEQTLTLTKNGGVLELISARRTFCISEIRSCWYRKPIVDIEVAERVGSLDAMMVTHETQAAIKGVIGALDAFWVSHPDCIELASWKYVQLRRASDCGFSVPQYLISNDLPALKEFFKGSVKVILKRLDDRHLKIPSEDLKIAFYVRPLSNDDIDELLSSRPISPVFLQTYIDKLYDVRLIAIGRELFAVAFRKPDGGTVTDWREGLLDLEHFQVEIPDDVRRRAIDYLKCTGLEFGAFDFSVDRSENWWFLECNPNGQWLWLEVKTRLPLVSAMVDLLQGRGSPVAAK